MKRGTLRRAAGPAASMTVLALLGGALALAQDAGGRARAPGILPADQSCLDCHGEVVARRNVHAVARKSEDCAACHMPQGNRHEFRYPAQGGKLCTDCHELDLSGVVHKPVGEGGCMSCHSPHASDQPKLLAAPMGELCAGCHEELRGARRAHVHGPFGGGLCQVCHAGHASPHGKLLREAGSGLCLSCHEQMAPDGAATWHKPAQEDCMQCHSGHESDAPYVVKETAPALCLGCHEVLRSSMASAAVVHKALEQDRSCLGCHDPHLSPRTRLLRDDSGALCVKCHARTYPQERGRPLPDFAAMLNELPRHHGPVKEKNCEGCHLPHVSPNFRLLKEPYPEKFYDRYREANYALCFSCHNVEIFRDESSTLTGFRDGARNLHHLHVNREKGRTCRACHATHASASLFHIRETTPFGSWDLPIGFEKTPEGGRCAPGCHVEQSYRRGG